MKKPSATADNISDLKTSAEVLEFEPLRRLLGRYISSPAGRRELEKLQPHADLAGLTEALEEAGEAVEYLRLATRPQPATRGAAIRVDFGGLPDLEGAVNKLHIEGANLNPRRSSTCSCCWTVPPTPRASSPRLPDASRDWVDAR